MNIEAIVLGLLAIADLGLLIHLPRSRRRVQQERIAHSLQLAIQRDNKCTHAAPKLDQLRRAS